jgi:hypothetical protein
MAIKSDSVREIFKGLRRLLGLARSLHSPDQEETPMITAPTLRLTKPIPG